MSLVHCSYCLTPINVRPYKLKIQKNFFCNHKCMASWKSKHFKGKNNHRSGKSLSNETKRKISLSTKGRIPWNKGKKASQANIESNRKGHLGQKAWNKQETFAKCDNCNTLFHKKLSLLNKSFYHFCNKDCKASWMSKHFKGKNNPFYENHSRLGVPRSLDTKLKIQATHRMNVKINPEFYKQNGYKAWSIAKKKFAENRSNGKYIYNEINMRSSWEVLVAQWLDDQDLTWFYEPDELDCEDLGVYVPDFYVKEWNKYIEVKGFWQQRGINKFNYWKDKCPTKFILFNRKALEKIGVLKC